MITINKLLKEMSEGKQYDGTITSPHGSVETGVNSIYDFVFWKTNDNNFPLGLAFMCEDDPDTLIDIEEVLELFTEKEDDTLFQQLKRQGIECH